MEFTSFVIFLIQSYGGGWIEVWTELKPRRLALFFASCYTSFSLLK